VIPVLGFAVILCALVVFQVALANGAPWGRFAWGGQHAGALPRRLRIASGISVLVYVVLAVPALDLAGIVDVVPNAVAQVAAWVVFGYLCLGVVMNAASRSTAERAIMTPVAAVLAVLAFVVALSGPVPRAFEGLVLENGNRTVFCTAVMESYPPQCGGESPVVIGWDWDAVSGAEQSGDVRWGAYRFDGVLDGNTLRVTEGAREPLG
jgi:hypothetical protein